MSQQDFVQFKYELKPPYEAPNPEVHYKNFEFTILTENGKITLTVPACILLDEGKGIKWCTTAGTKKISGMNNNSKISEGLSYEDDVLTEMDFELMRKPLIDFLIEIQTQSGKNCSRYLKQLSDPDFKYV